MSFYRIADLNITMLSYGVTEKHARKWQVDQVGFVDLSIPVAPLLYSNPGNFTLIDEYSEYHRTEAAFNSGLLDNEGFLLHASAIAFQEKGYCFCAASGIGKSTHTGLWQKVFGENRVHIINDDKPALRFKNGCWYVYGTPWSGKTDQSENICVPLGGIFLLMQGKNNHIEIPAPFHIINFLSGCISGPLSAVKRKSTFSLLDNLINNIPIWGLLCRPDEEAVWTAYNAIMEEEKKHQ